MAINAIVTKKNRDYEFRLIQPEWNDVFETYALEAYRLIEGTQALWLDYRYSENLGDTLPFLNVFYHTDETHDGLMLCKNVLELSISTELFGKAFEDLEEYEIEEVRDNTEITYSDEHQDLVFDITDVWDRYNLTYMISDETDHVLNSGVRLEIFNPPFEEAW